MMASPFKTHETMDLARALLEEDSKSFTSCSERPENYANEDDSSPKPSYPIGDRDFDCRVVTKESSTDLISTQLAEGSCTDISGGKVRLNKSRNNVNNNLPAMMMVRDLNAGKGLIDDDGKPVVGKVFSRVIQVSGTESKPKQLKSHHRGRSCSSCCRDRHGGTQVQDKERSSSARPQSGQQGGSSPQQCQTHDREFSDEIVFCTGSSKEIM